MVYWGKCLRSFTFSAYFFFLILIPAMGYADGSKLLNTEDLRSFYGITKEYRDLEGRFNEITLAEIDQSFAGMEDLKKQTYLPEGLVTKHFEWPDAGYTSDKEEYNVLKMTHGREMAQIIYGMLNFAAGGPFYELLNGKSKGPFGESLNYIDGRPNIQMVGTSSTVNCCSNLDGTGIIPNAIRQTIKPSQIFLAAAGDFGGKVYNGSIVTEEGSKRIKFRNGKTELRVQVLHDDLPTTITLMWTGTNEDPRVGSNKNLNLYLEKPNHGGPLESGVKKQVVKYSVGPDPDPAKPKGAMVRTDPTESYLLREELNLRLGQTKVDSDDPEKNEYYTIYVTKEGGDFTENDRLRIVLKSNLFEQENPPANAPPNPILFAEGDATPGEEVSTPSDMDDKEVVSVGDLHHWSSNGPTYDGRWKPTVIMPLSDAHFSDGKSTSGTSQGRAMLTALGVYLKLADSRLRNEDFAKFVEVKTYTPDPRLKPKYPRSLQPVALTNKSRTVSLRKEMEKSGPLRTVVKRLKEFLNDEPIAAWRSEEGHLILGIAESVGELKIVTKDKKKKKTEWLVDFFKNIDSEDFDRYATYFYAADVTTKAQKKADPKHRWLEVYHYVRDRKASNGDGKKRPWNVIGGEPSDYFEVRRIPMMRDGIIGVMRDGGWVHNVFKMPTIEELKEVIDKRIEAEERAVPAK